MSALKQDMIRKGRSLYKFTCRHFVDDLKSHRGAQANKKSQGGSRVIKRSEAKGIMRFPIINMSLKGGEKRHYRGAQLFYACVTKTFRCYCRPPRGGVD